MTNPSPRKARRSAVLIILSLVTLLLSLLGWVRLIQGVANWRLLGEIGPAVLPFYLALSGFLWGIIGLAAAVGVWLRQRWALILLGCAVTSFTLWYWLDRAFLSANPAANTNWLFGLVLSAGVLVYFGASILAIWEETR